MNTNEKKPIKAVKMTFVSDWVFYSVYKDEITGKFYGVSDKSPLFCLEADTEEEAREKANEALVEYAKMVLAKE